MNDKRSNAPEDEALAAQAERESDAGDSAASQAEAASAAEASVRRGGRVLTLIIVLSLSWYLLADRFTPYTSQARVSGYVIGVAPKVAGLVTAVYVENNRLVEEGDRLFEIDRAQYEIAVAKARSDLENARRQVEAGGAAVEAARASLSAARANELKARQDFNRLQRLYEEDPGTISTRRLEVSRASLDQAEARVTGAQADIERAIEQMGGEDRAENAILLAALAAVDKAELDLANTEVVAASRGIITDLRADVGQFAGTGSPVMTLVATHDLWVSAEFTENNLGHVTQGTEVEILFDAVPGAVFPGRVSSIGIGVDSGQGHPAGTLPTIQNNRDWLRQSQRFPVIVHFELPADSALAAQVRIGGQASVVAYSEGATLLKLLGQAHIRLMSWLSYAY